MDERIRHLIFVGLAVIEDDQPGLRLVDPAAKRFGEIVRAIEFAADRFALIGFDRGAAIAGRGLLVDRHQFIVDHISPNDVIEQFAEVIGHELFPYA